LRKSGAFIPVDTNSEIRSRAGGLRTSCGYNIDQITFIANNYYQNCVVRRDMQTKVREGNWPGLEREFVQAYKISRSLRALAGVISADGGIFFVGVGVSLLYILTTT
jgi:hypothetical protein